MYNSSREIFIEGNGGKRIFLRVWDNITNAKGVVQIIHGMAEHSERYSDFAKYLNGQGYIVYADDHRGHGRTVEGEDKCGYLGEDGFNDIVEDENIITEYIKKEYPEIPVYIFAHSFGSFIGQEYITRYSKNINGIILSGSAKQDGIDVRLATILAKLQRAIFDEKKEAKLIDKMSFGSYNNKVEKPQNKFAWLTRDTKEVDKYIEDELCGFVSSINFYYNFFNGLNKLYDMEKLKRINKDLKILVISGDKDPVGKYGKSVEKLYKQYVDLGIKEASLKLYKDGRHELLNETNKEEIYSYIGKWIS